jgi:carboxyl-terminal processing protease
LGYIKIELFSETTYDEFKKALQQLKNKGMTALVLDLRGNTGGYLKQANLIADEFLPQGTLIFYTRDKKNRINKVYATGRGDFEKGNLYVLIDENTASASEIIAGALQDNDRAVIVGRRSFGKGLVQEEVQLKDGSIIRLTTARYYTPSGRSIQTPYEKGKKEEYEKKFYERYYSGELFNKDSIHLSDSLKYHTKHGRTVYGGGGIVPDIFIPLDKLYQSESYQYILLRNKLDRILKDYALKHFRNLRMMTSSEFVNNDTVGASIFRFLLKKNHIDESHMDAGKRKRFENLLHALLGKDLYGTDVFYRIRLQVDPMIDTLLHLTPDQTRQILSDNIHENAAN